MNKVHFRTNETQNIKCISVTTGEKLEQFYLCLSCGYDTKQMEVEKEVHFCVGGLAAYYRCKCGKEVLKVI